MGDEAQERGSDAATTETVAEGVEVRTGKKGASIRIVFNFAGKRRRETLGIAVTPGNVRYAIRLRGEVMNAIARGTFNYAETFPQSKAGIEAARRKEREDSGPPRFGALLDDYIDDLRAAANVGAVSPSTVATYVKWSNARIRAKIGETPIDEITPQFLRDWIKDMVKDGLAAKSVRNVIGIVSGVLGQAVIDDIIKANPVKALQMKKLVPKKRAGADDEDIDPFNATEIGEILAASDRPEERFLILFLLGSGARPGEAMAFKWHHVDWKRSEIKIVDNIVDAEIGTVEKDTKTASIRTIPMLPSLREALIGMRPISELKSRYVFLNARGERWTRTQHVRRRWEIIVKRAKIRYRTLYQTRHTFASTLLMNGEPELLVAKLLGHTTVEMVRKHYGKYIPQPDGIKLKSDYASLGASSPKSPAKASNSN